MRPATVLTLFLIVASPVAAQDGNGPGLGDQSQVGTRFKIAEEPMGSVDMRRFQKKVARCLAKEDGEMARKVLKNSDPANIDYRALGIGFDEVLKSLNFDRCMVRAIPRNARGIRVRIAPRVLRNLLAEEVYLRENDDAPILHDGAPEFLENRFFVGGAAYPMAEVPAKLSDCVVARETELAHELLKSNPTSSGERKLVESLSGAFGACLSDDFVGLEYTLAEIRAFIADGLWSRINYASMPSAVGKSEAEAAE